MVKSIGPIAGFFACLFGFTLLGGVLGLDWTPIVVGILAILGLVLFTYAYIKAD